MLRTRLLTAAVLAPLILLVVVLGEPWLSLLIGVAAFLALVELVALLDAAGYQPPQVLTILSGMAITAAWVGSATGTLTMEMASCGGMQSGKVSRGE